MMIFGKIMLGLAATAFAGAGLLCSEGLVHVDVREKQPQGHHIHVLAPALIAPIGVYLAPKADLADASAQIRPYLPTIRAALDGLRETNDVTLVEVNEPDQHVRVVKEGGSIVVDVDDPENSVHVSTPIRAIASTVEQLAAVAPSQADTANPSQPDTAKP